MSRLIAVVVAVVVAVVAAAVAAAVSLVCRDGIPSYPASELNQSEHGIRFLCVCDECGAKWRMEDHNDLPTNMKGQNE
jgi:hypothetical protein